MTVNIPAPKDDHIQYYTQTKQKVLCKGEYITSPVALACFNTTESVRE